MAFASNLTLVIGRLQTRFDGIDGAVARALAVKYWKPLLRQVAEQTLRAQWGPVKEVGRRELYERVAPLIVDTLVGEFRAAGPVAEFALHVPGAPGLAGEGPPPKGAASGEADGAGGEVLGPVELARKSVQNTPKKLREPPTWHGIPTGNDLLDAVRAGLRQWVEEEKDKKQAPGERDYGLTDDEIAQNLEYVLGLRGSPKDFDETMMQAGEGLARHVNEYLIREGYVPPDEAEWHRMRGGLVPAPAAARGMTGKVLTVAPEWIEPGVARAWLAAVLAAWGTVVRSTLPGKLEFELARARGARSPGGLL